MRQWLWTNESAQLQREIVGFAHGILIRVLELIDDPDTPRALQWSGPDEDDTCPNLL